MGGYTRGRLNPAINSVDASGGESRTSTRRRMSQRGCPRHNDLLCSSNSVERLNPPRTTNARAPPRLLDAMSSEEQATVPPLSTLGVTTGSAEGESTKEENTHPGQNKTKRGIDRNVGEHSSHFSGGGDIHSGVSVKSFRSTVSVDLLGSANSIDSMQSLGSPNSVVSMQSLGSAHSINSTESFRARALAREGFPQDNTFAEASGRGATLGANEQATEEIRTVEETICESWKELPWQARLCPRAIEEREDVRRACALEKEVTETNY